MRSVDWDLKPWPAALLSLEARWLESVRRFSKHVRSFFDCPNCQIGDTDTNCSLFLLALGANLGQMWWSRAAIWHIGALPMWNLWHAEPPQWDFRTRVKVAPHFWPLKTRAYFCFITFTKFGSPKRMSQVQLCCRSTDSLLWLEWVEKIECEKCNTPDITKPASDSGVVEKNRRWITTVSFVLDDRVLTLWFLWNHTMTSRELWSRKWFV